MSKEAKKGRYIVTYFKTAEHQKPAVLCVTDDLEKAEGTFKEERERKIYSTVLYDKQNDRVMKFAIEGEPKSLSLAIELARNGNELNVNASKTKKEGNVVEAVEQIESVASALMGNSVPGIGHVVEAHFLGPYYAMQGDGVKAAQACAGLWGGMTGTVLGLLAGPAGAVAGGIAGATLASEATCRLFKAYNHPDKCKKCKGTGLVEDYRTCKQCDGFGYIKK